MIKQILPLLCHSCCFLAQRVCPTQPVDGAPSLVGRWGGTDPQAGSKRPEQTFLQGQIAELLHAKLKTDTYYKSTNLPIEFEESKVPQHTKWFKKLVQLLSYGDGFRVLSHMIVDDGLIVVQRTVFNIIQPINVFCWCVNLRDNGYSMSNKTAIIHFCKITIFYKGVPLKRFHIKWNHERKHNTSPQLPDSSFSLGCPSDPMWCSDHFYKTLPQLYSWQSCNHLCCVPAKRQGVWETHRIFQP